ncbi:MAG: CBS domain-containing protein, partial [Tetrasphaera sp.]|nr:CBS domain-containing protein [Tetrasphaera sp.]
MKIAEIVRTKGTKVVTIRSDKTVKELLALLAEHQIGAVVVSDDGETVSGIVSERDIVRHLHSTGAEILDGPVSAIMTHEVFTCTHDLQLDDLEHTMTERRI